MSKILNLIIVAIILVSFGVSGYYSRNNISDMAYVVAIGIDKRRK